MVTFDRVYDYNKAKIEELESNSKSNSKINNIRDLYRGINDFKKGYQPRTIIVKDEKGDLVADFHSIMTRWKNYFSQLLNVYGAKDVRQEEIHTTEPLVLELSAFEVELAIEKLKNHKSPGESHLVACGTTDVTKLIVAFRLAMALSRPMNSTSSLQEIISSF